MYDFRLCLSSGSNSVWFSADGSVGYFEGKVFCLSTSETEMALRLFGELDSLLRPQKKTP